MFEWVAGWVGGRREKVYPGCISVTIRCRNLKGTLVGGVGVQHHGVTLIGPLTLLL